MRVISSDDDGTTVALSAGELATLANAINETLEAVDEAELGARVGASGDDLRLLQGELRDALDAG